MNKKVLILNGQYLPGYKGGGPIQSCLNMIENLADHYEFKVLCADRDLKQKQPYQDIRVNEWNRVGNAQVYYMSPDRQTLAGFRKILNETEYDILYLNGFFSPIFTIKPLLLRRLGKLKKSAIILTPRGDFTGGLENKKLKKIGYISVVKLIGMYGNLLWHATSDIEEKDIRKLFPLAKIFVVQNLTTKFIERSSVTEKESGKLRLVFISRIFPKKNIKYALEVLKRITEGEVVFDIYGPLEDQTYWEECTRVIKELPQNVTARYCGEVPHEQIAHIFERYHAFFFPTHGENYGHVIVEAMMNNCLCILSKGVTPWDEYIEELDIGASLNEQTKFVEIIKRLLVADQSEMDRMLKLNNKFIERKTNSDKDILKYIHLLKASDK